MKLDSSSSQRSARSREGKPCVPETAGPGGRLALDQPHHGVGQVRVRADQPLLRGRPLHRVLLVHQPVPGEVPDQRGGAGSGCRGPAPPARRPRVRPAAGWPPGRRWPAARRPRPRRSWPGRRARGGAAAAGSAPTGRGSAATAPGRRGPPGRTPRQRRPARSHRRGRPATSRRSAALAAGPRTARAAVRPPRGAAWPCRPRRRSRRAAPRCRPGPAGRPPGCA